MKKKKTSKPRDSFTESDKHVLHGTKLYPWTAGREIASQAMGLLYPEIGKEGWDQYRRTKVYPGALKDTIICLWICTQTETQVDDADVAPVEAYRQARKWAASLGIHKLGSDAFWQAYNKFADIVMEARRAMTAPKVEPGDDDHDPNE